MFKKRTEVFKKRDREGWLQMKAVLKESGLSGVKSGHYQQDTVIACGCGAKLDPRNFGDRGKIDRDIYWIRVNAEDEAKAVEILKKNGLVPQVDEDILLDASQRKKPVQDVF